MGKDAAAKAATTKTKKTGTPKTSAAAAGDASGRAGSARGYTVLARRYRSRDFAEVVGQEPIARTLQRAIEQGRTAHAYLFCGTRGVGKTSMARIFAKALQLAGAEGEAAPAEAEAIAGAVLRGEDLDVIEIDGASNRGINEARDLIAGSGLAPTRGRYKIYIIDEVHMLTREAFNALLKTMEEPPPHVKFILCTTDPQKVPATIQSRCQRFDFRAIPTARIGAHLTEVLASEGVEADEDVVLTVAALGNGSMRDALSLLDRLLAGGGGRLTMEVAREILGLPATEVVDAILDAVVAGDPAAGLTAANELIVGGATVESALEMLVDRLRTLMLIAACGDDTTLVDLTSESRAAAVRHAGHFDVAGLVYLIATCDVVARNARGSATGRALYDAAIVRLCLAERFGDVSRLLGGDAGAEKKKPVARGERLTPTPTPPRAAAESGRTPAAPAGRAAPASAGIAVGRAAPAPAATSTPRAAAPAASTNTADPSGEMPDLATLWRRLQDTAGGPMVSVLSRVRPVRLDGRDLYLTPVDGQGSGYLTNQVERLAAPLSTIAGCTIHVRLEAAGAPGAGGTPKPAANGSTPASGRDHGTTGRAATVPTTPSGGAAAEAMGLPMVRDAMEIFDASVSDVRDVPRPADDAPAPGSPD